MRKQSESGNSVGLCAYVLVPNGLQQVIGKQNAIG